MAKPKPVVRDEEWIDAVLKAGDRLCNEAQQMTVSLPMKATEQAQRLEQAVENYRAVTMARYSNSHKNEVPNE